MFVFFLVSDTVVLTFAVNNNKHKQRHIITKILSNIITKILSCPYEGLRWHLQMSIETCKEAEKFYKYNILFSKL